MVKLLQKMDDLSMGVYWAHNFTELMDLGGRVSYKIDDLSFGASVLWEDFEHNNEKLNYEIDAQYNLLDLLDLSTQFSVIDAGLDEIEDLRAFLFASYSQEIQLPVIGKIKPYAGIDTFSKYDALITFKQIDIFSKYEENITFAGINFEPITNGFIKVEYQINSEKEIEDVFNIQVVYVF